LDWGRWYDRSFSKEPLLTLEETLRTYLPITRLLIEIKSSPLDRRRGISTRLADIVVKRLSMVDAARHSDNAFVLSFDEEVLEHVHRKAPHLRCVWNLPESDPEKALLGADDPSRRLWGCCSRLSDFTESLTKMAGGLGLKCFTYSCNTARHVKRAMRAGPDGILTDRPGWLSRYATDAGLRKRS
jgi:glycerophosphoryl diester phosphodiesterase